MENMENINKSEEKIPFVSPEDALTMHLEEKDLGISNKIFANMNSDTDFVEGNIHNIISEGSFVMDKDKVKYSEKTRHLIYDKKVELFSIQKKLKDFEKFPLGKIQSAIHNFSQDIYGGNPPRYILDNIDSLKEQEKNYNSDVKNSKIEEVQLLKDIDELSKYVKNDPSVN